jgi:hypothetical protein
MTTYTKVLREQPSSSTYDLGMPGEVSTWSQEFLFVYSPASPMLTAADIMGDALVPKPATRHPTIPQWVCRSVTVAPSGSSSQAWNVRVKWTTRVAFGSSAPWFRITRSTSARTAAGYRSGDIWSGVASDGTVAFPPTSAIGGVKVDSNGVPLQWKISQQTIVVEHLWDRTKNRAADAMSGAASSPDPPSEWTSVYANARNNATFLGWPAGYVTYQGWTANQSPDEWLVVSHRFLADDWQHLEQRPAPTPAGTKLLDTGPTWVGIATASAKTVVWYQPYPTTANLSNLFTWQSGLWSAITSPGPSWPTTSAP